MSTKQNRKTGRDKFIRAEDIQNYLYDSDDDHSYKSLDEEQTETKSGNNRCFVLNGHETGERILTSAESEKEISVSRIPVDPIYKFYDSKSYIPIKSGGQHTVETKKNFLILEKLRGESAEEKNFQESSNNSFTNCTVDLIQENSEKELLPLVQGGRKRHTQVESSEPSFSKRVKVEQNKNMSENSNNQSLNITLEDNNKSETFTRRDVNTIISELDSISRRLKEGYAKYKSPAQWGVQIMKNCEKWDTRYIPQKVLERYQKLLEGNEVSDSILGNAESDNNCVEPKFSDSKCESNKVEGEEAAEAIDYDRLQMYSTHEIEDDLNSFNSDSSCKNPQRNRNLDRSRTDERLSGESDYLMRERQGKGNKSFKGKKNRKLIMSRMLVEDIDRGQMSQEYQNEDDSLDSNKNFEKLKIEDLPSSVPSQLNKSHYEETTNAGSARVNEDDQVACPICGNEFEKVQIESHAIRCAIQTFHD